MALQESFPSESTSKSSDFEVGILPESRSFDNAESSITLTVEEYERMQTDPVKVLEIFCREVCAEEPSEHLKKLFEDAVAMVEEDPA